ncbi:MAG TPA: glycoside hydrolase family 25 protein [Thermoanaerobaculia bacterium]|nr:glycoside hydrolase family 25 protein [Thermoanaerobaculia bacterium]
MSEQVQGIDVSHLQQTIDWTQVQKAGKAFAFMKATDGITWTDPSFMTNWSGATAAGLLRGAYHFYETNDDPSAQAENFLNAVQLARGDLPPVVDIEAIKGGTSASQVVQDLQTWLDVVEQATGRIPMIYTDSGFWSSLGTSAFGHYPLWIAEYGVQSPKLPAGWASWDFWQFSESGTVAGISTTVDLDVFYGTLAELESLTQG